jgi:hypothetical protein
MKIISSELWRQERIYEVNVKYKGKAITFSVRTIDKMEFHETPDDIQNKNFKLIKEYIEKTYK